MRAFLFALLTLAGLSPAVAGDVSTFELENGLKGVVIEDHRAPVVFLLVWYKAGSADEKRGNSGFAHYL